ncbi:hypothetical protein ABZV14_05800 [Streptosporangium canum]|uniref:hypothetical protein n=1 Tax=Streptosporangium canum TaxID=324952 RepID=UPI0033AB462F
MAERSLPFDGGSGGVVTEEDWLHLTKSWQDDGVITDSPSSSDLTVYSDAEAGKLYVRPGRANVRGFHYFLDSVMEVGFSANTDPTNTRADLVVLKLDRGANRITVVVKEGTPSATPAPPLVSRSDLAPELPLARTLVPPNSAFVPSGSPNVLDIREFVGKRIRLAESDASLPVGSIFFKQSDGRFYGKGPGSSAPFAVGDIAPGNTILACTSTTRPSTSAVPTYIYETDTKQTLVWNGTAWTALASGGSSAQLKSKSADQTVTAAADDTALTLPMASGAGQYIVEGQIVYRMAAATTSCQLALKFPSTINTWYTFAAEYHGSANTTLARTTSITSPQSGWITFGGPAASTAYSLEFKGVLRQIDAAAGNFVVSYVNPPASMTIIKGSFLKIEKA